MPRYIDAVGLVENMLELREHLPRDRERCALRKALRCVEESPTVDAVEVVRCRDCVFYKPRHIKLNDGSEREYLPGEELVSISVGINVGGQCMVDEGMGYDGDKSVFRGENDFCSRGIRKIDAEVEG